MSNSNSKSTTYFNPYEHLGNVPLNSSIRNPGEKIKLEFSIINPGEGSYSIQAKLYAGQAVDFNSETKEGHFEQKLIFDKFLICDFFFERQQNLSIILKKNNSPININTTLGCIVGLNKCTFTHKYSPTESLMIKAEKMGINNDILKIRLCLKENNLENSKLFTYNKIYYVVTCKNKKLYSSEQISNNGTFLPAQIPIYLLQPFYTVSLFNSNNQLLATFNKTLQEINSQKNKLQLKIPMNNNNYLYLYDNSELTKNYTFIDYLKSGVIIALSIGIDFTGSNGHPLDDGTLHSIKGGKPNDYERAIIACGNIVAHYDYDQLFPVYGFGAIVNSSFNKEPSMCFNLNFKDNPDIYTVNNILKTYHECIEQNKLTFAGPTNFAPLIRTAISKINKKNIFEYHILMILTDGIIDDLQDTIDILVEGSFLPLSVIIIGIGNEDFKKMEILDGDDVPLRSRTGQIWQRDLVQFVPFSKYQNDAKILAMEVLAEIPKQITEYYQFKDLNPDKIKYLTMKNNNNPPNNPANFASNIKINNNNQNNSNPYNPYNNGYNHSNT